MRLTFALLVAYTLSAADPLQDVKVRGAALEAQGRWMEAAAVYRAALAEITPGEPPEARFWLLISLGEISFEQRDYTGAGGWLGQAETMLQGRASGPERVRLWNAWGTLHLVQGNLTAAHRELSRAVEIAEAPADLAAALHNLAAVEMNAGNLPQAVENETRALVLWRQQFGDHNRYVMKAWVGLSSIQGLCGDWKAAESSLQQALAIERTPEALANYALVLDKLKRRKEAREIRKQLKSPAPSLPPVVDVKAFRQEDERLRVRSR